MLLKQFHIQYFRSLYDLTMPLKPITIIIGPNASGKSNLFRSLRFIYDAVAGDRLEWQAYDGQMDDLLWYGYDEYGHRPEQVNFDLKFSENDSTSGMYSASFHCGDYLDVNSELLYIQHPSLADEPLTYFERKGETIRHFFTEKNDRVRRSPLRSQAHSARVLYLREAGPSLKQPFASSIYEHITGWRFMDINLSRARQETFIPQYPEDVPPLAGDAGNLSAFLWALYQKQTDDFDSVVSTISDFIELPQKILVEHDAERGGQAARYRFVEQPFGENRLLPPSSMSDGTIRLLALLALLLGDRSVSLACLEEPDHGMHPHLMLYLADVLRQIAQTPEQDINGVKPQVIITTHNPEFMDCFDITEEQDYLQVYVAERDETGKTTLTPATAQEFAPWLQKYRLGEAVRRRFV